MYSYEEHRDWINGPDGTRAVAFVLNRVREVMEPAGAARMYALWPSTGDSDTMMAAVDRVVELGVIRELDVTPRPAGQHRVFVPAAR